jgi:hypothetical protein
MASSDSLQVRHVELLIIGAGVAGLAVARAFGEGALIIDADPGGYKIGESVIPEQFHDPRMAACIGAVRELPSWSAKLGTLFCDGDERVFFPLAQHADRSMHVFRQELEPQLTESLGVHIERATVLAIDLPTRTVTTSHGLVRSRLPIVDCSGPAMLVAKAADLVQTLWPVWATWGYCDAIADDAAFWDAANTGAWSMSALDVPSGDLLAIDPVGCRPSELTTLTRVRDGIWSWQIPLWRRSILSVGLVSRLGPVDDDALRQMVNSALQPCWRAVLREPLDAAAAASAAAVENDRFGSALPAATRVPHRRAGFARRARLAAGDDFVLVGDAFAFADPVYSVGTGLAVTAGLQLGDHLRTNGWRPGDAERWHRRSEDLLLRALDAFRYWYDGSVMRDKGEAVRVQDDFLVGRGFRGDVFAAYSAVVADAQRGAEARIDTLVRAGLPAALILAGVRADANTHAVLLDLASPAATLEVARDDGSSGWWRGAGLRLSYRPPADGSGLSPALSAMMTQVAVALEADAARWIHCLELVGAMTARNKASATASAEPPSSTD